MYHNQTTIFKRFLAIILLSSQFLASCINPDIPNLRINHSQSSLDSSSRAISGEKNIPLLTASSLDSVTSEQALASSQVNVSTPSFIYHASVADSTPSVIFSPPGQRILGNSSTRQRNKEANAHQHWVRSNKLTGYTNKRAKSASLSPASPKAQLEALTITAQGGYPVKLSKVEGDWIATLEEQQGFLSRMLHLPIRITPGFSLKDLFNHQQDWHQRYVQVVFPEKTPHNQGYLCIGMTGIVGGMKGQQKSKCPYPEDQRKWDPQLGKYVCPGKDKHDRYGNPNPTPSRNSASASTASTRSADASTTRPSSSDPTTDPLAFLRRPKESEKEREERLYRERQEESLAAYKRILEYQEKIKSDLIEHNQWIYKQIKQTVKELRSKYKQASKWVIVIENLPELEAFQTDLTIAIKQVEQLRGNLKIVEGKHRGITRAQIELYRADHQLEGEAIYFEPISALSRLYSLQTPLEKLKEWFVFLDTLEKSIQQEADMLYKLSKLHNDGPDNHESIDQVIVKAQAIKSQLKSSRKKIKCYGAHAGKKEENTYTPDKEQLQIHLSSIKATEEKLDQIITRFKQRKETVKPGFKKVVEYTAYQAIAHFQTKRTELSELVNYPVESYDVEVRPQQGKENVAYGELEGVFLDNETVSIEKFLDLMELIVVVRGRDRQATRINVTLQHSEPLKLSTIDSLTYSAFINQLNKGLETGIEKFNQLVKEGTNAKAIVEEGNRCKIKLQEATQRLRSYPTKEDKKEALSYLTNLEKGVEEKIKEEAHTIFVEAINEEVDQAGARTGALAKAGSNPETTIEEATKFKRKLEEILGRVSSYTYKRDQLVDNLRGIINEVEQIISAQGEKLDTNKLEAIKEKGHNSYLKQVIFQVSEEVERIEADLLKMKSGDIKKMINPLKVQHEALMKKLSILDNLAGADQETKVTRKAVVEKILGLLDEIDRLLKEGEEEQRIEEVIKLQFGRITEKIAAEIGRRTSDSKEKAKDTGKEITQEIARTKEAISANKNLRFILDEATKCKHELGLLKGSLKEDNSKQPELLGIIETGIKQVEEIVNEQKRKVLTGISLPNKEEMVATINKVEHEVVALEQARSKVAQAKKKVDKMVRKIKKYKKAKKKAKRKIIATATEEKQSKEELSFLIRQRKYASPYCFMGEDGIIYLKEYDPKNDGGIKEVEEKINKASDDNRRTKDHLEGLRYFIGKYEVELMVANRKLAEAQQEEQRLLKEQKARVESSQTESSRTERQQAGYTVAIRKEREELRERVGDYLRTCQKDREFTKQREGLLSTLEKLTREPNNKTLQALKGEQLAILQANPVYQGLVELGIEAAALRLEAEEKGNNGLFEAVEMNRNLTSALGKTAQYQKEADAIKQEVILPLRAMLGCPNTPRGTRRAAESIKGFGESLLDTCKGLVVDLPLLLGKVGIEGTASLMSWEDRLGIQDGCAKIEEACKVLFDDTMQSWEEPEEYEMRMLAVKSLAKREQLYRRAFDAENYHLGQDKMLGYVTAELLQFLFGGEIIKGAAKGVGKGAEFIKGAQRGVKLEQGVVEGSKVIERIKDILKPGGELIGKQVGKDPAIRTVTKEEAERIIKQLMAAGAKRAFKQPVKYNGIWYELPEGGEFGIRTKSSLKSTRYDTQHTIDLEPLKLEIIKLKY